MLTSKHNKYIIKQKNREQTACGVDAKDANMQGATNYLYCYQVFIYGILAL